MGWPQVKSYFRWEYASPFFVLIVGAVPTLLKILDFIGRGESLMNLPEWINHPLFGLILIGGGFVWLIYLTRQPEAKGGTGILTQYGTPYENPKHPVLGVAIASVIVAGVIAVPSWLYFRTPSEGKAVTVEGKEPPRRAVSTLLTRYSTSVLPISIKPNSTAYIVQLNPNITQGLWEQRNDRNTPEIWPPNIGKDVVDQFYLCQLTNHTEKTYVDVALSFNTAFFEVKKTGERVQRKKNKDGTFSLSFPVNSDKNRITFFDKAGDVKINGALLKSFLHPIVIPVINPKQTVNIYLINQSRFVAGFDFPKRAVGILADGGEEIDLTLIRPKVNILDAIPWSLLPPPMYHWVGVPDAP